MDAGTGVLEELESLIRSGHVDRGLRQAQDRLKRAEEVGDRLAAARCHAAMTLAYQYQGRHREALLSSYTAMDSYETLGDAVGLGITLTRAAVDLAALGDAGESMRLLTRAHELCGRIDSPALAFRLWNNMAVAYQSMGQLTQAREAIESAVRVSAESGDEQARVHAQSNQVAYELEQAAAQLRDGEHQAGLDALTAGLDRLVETEDLCTRNDWPHLMPDMLLQAAHALHACGRVEEARVALLRGVAIAQHLGRTRDLFEFWLQLARLARLEDQLDRAWDHVAKVESLADATDNDQQLARYHEERSMLCAASGQFEQALSHHQQFHALVVARLERMTDTRAQVLSIRLGNERARLQAELLRLRASQLEGDVEVLTGEKDRLTQAALEDPLTGVGNRRYFDERVAGLSDLTLVLIDLDHFEGVNDTYGHATGDRVLVHVGAILQQACRPEDVVCRYGGEEFVVAVESVDEPSAVALAERLLTLIRDHEWPAVSAGLQVTASAGVAAGDGRPVPQVLARADEALYLAKASGRDCARTFTQLASLRVDA